MAETTMPSNASTLVVDYMTRQGPILHEAFSLSSTFNREREEFEARDVYREYLETLIKYERTSEQTLEFDPRDCPWTKVISEMHKAQQAAEESKLRDKGLLIHNIRKLSRTYPVVAGALEAIPDDLKILHGGLAVIFNLAVHREKNRQSILDAFETLPDIIVMAANKARSFPGDVKLRQSIKHLSKVLLVAIPSLVDFLHPGTLLGKARAPFRAYDIKNSLDLVRHSSDQVKACAENLVDQVIIDTSRDTAAIKDSAARIEENVRIVGQGMDNHFKEADSCMQELIQEQHFMTQQVTDALASQNGMFQMLKDAVLKQLHDQDLKLDAWFPISPTSDSSRQLLSLLLHHLQVPERQDTQDLLLILQRDRASDSRAMSQANFILESKQFRYWLGSRGSYTLLIDGHLDPSLVTKISSMSFFSANMIQVLRDIDPVATIHFFCGQHVANNDQLSGPQGLIRSLLFQLARLTMLHSVGGLPDISTPGNVAELCQSFQVLVASMPSAMSLVCIIDDITRFERDCWSEDYRIVMEMLFSAGQQARFKLLITSPTKSLWLQNAVSPTQHISVRQTGLRTSRTEAQGLVAAIASFFPGA